QEQPITCTIAVIRSILWDFEGSCLSESEMLQTYPNLTVNECTPTEKTEQFWEERGYTPINKNNESFNEILEMTSDENTHAMITFDYGQCKYHCVLFGYVCDGNVFYMDPDESSGSTLVSKTIEDFENLRKRKSGTDPQGACEVIYVKKS